MIGIYSWQLETRRERVILYFGCEGGKQVSNQAEMVKEETANPSQEGSKNRILPVPLLVIFQMRKVFTLLQA